MQSHGTNPAHYSFFKHFFVRIFQAPAAESSASRTLSHSPQRRPQTPPRIVLLPHLLRAGFGANGLWGFRRGVLLHPTRTMRRRKKATTWPTWVRVLDFGKGSFGEILRASWRGTPVAVKRILPSLSDDRLVTQDFRHEVNLLVKLRHPNIVQFLGAVTERKPLMLITEFLRGGDLHQFLKEKGSLSSLMAVNFALDIARGMAYLHNEPNVIIHRDLKPRNVLLVNSNADHLKVGDFGLSKLIKVQNSHDVYKMTGETGSYRYMAPEVFKHRKYDKKVDVFSFAMIFYEMLEGEPPLASYEPYEAAKYISEGHRPTFRAKGFLPELRELTDQCWAADMNQRPSFIEILKRLEKIKENLSPDHHWHLFSQ